MSPPDPATSAAALRYSIFSVQDHYPARPRSLAQFYDETIAQAELADRLGYHGFFLAEHHFHEYGAVPNPPVLLAAIAQRTQRLRLGSAIAVLPFRHPLTVAEDYAMLDVLSGGRVVLGVGSGYLKHEFEGFGIDGAEKRERFDEALGLLERALSGERISVKGKHTTLDNVAINVSPVQKPHPPIHVAILRKEAAYHVGRSGHNIMSVPYASVDGFDEIGALVAEFRRGRTEAGLPAQPGDDLFAFHTHVAESDAACRLAAEEAFDLYVATRLYAKSAVYDDILRRGICLFGGVDTVVDKLARLHRMGVSHVLTLQNFGMLPAERVTSSMRLLAEEVMPRVNRLIARGPAA